MIAVKLISGLGNQLFQYAVGRQISILKNDDLKIDLSFYGSQNLRSYKLNYFNIKGDILSSDEAANMLERYLSDALPFKVLRRLERYLPKQHRRRFKETQLWSYEPEIWKVHGTTYLDGYWQHYNYFQHFTPGIFAELTLRDECRLPYQALYDLIGADEHSVSIHIRRGDYLSDAATNQFFGVLPLSYYSEAVSFIRKFESAPSFYVFSDDLTWAKNNLKLNGAAKYIDIDNGNKDYVELDLMRNCRHNIIANSSFSWWGAFLNANPQKQVVSPKNWVQDKETNKRINIQLPSWTKI